MRDRDLSANRNPKSGCRPYQDIQIVQSFPSGGQRVDKSLGELKSLFQNSQDKAYSYIVRTVKLNHERKGFEQHGSAPNFQGDVLTLCTCKHQMRSRLSVEQWQANVWIVGFTSRTIHDGKHWLFYLAKVESAHESQSDLWNYLPANIRKHKTARRHYLGDLFEPKTPKLTGDERFSPSNYEVPEHHVHRKHPEHHTWEKDINYQHAATSSRPPLLMANPCHTFLWKKPMIFFAREKHCRDYLKWTSLNELIDHLREEDE